MNGRSKTREEPTLKSIFYAIFAKYENWRLPKQVKGYIGTPLSLIHQRSICLLTGFSFFHIRLLG